MPTGMFNTQNTIGIREDLSDVITNISPTDTPFYSSCGRGTCSNTFTEWQTITLATAATAGANAAVEGASATVASGTTTTRMGNRTQIFEKTLAVTETQLKVSTAGRASEWAFQMDIKMKELARDIESALLTSSAAAAGDVSADSARQLEGLGLNANQNATAGWLSSNVTTLLTTASDTGTRKNLTETTFNDFLQTIWTAGGNPNVVMVGPYNKRVISNFSANATRYTSTDQKGPRLDNRVDVYQSDFGEVQLKTNRYITGSTLCALEMQYWEVAYLNALHMEKLAKLGHSERGFLTCELTLKAYAPTSSGKMIGLATAAGATT